jgi:ferredoxin-NADP reductase
MIASAGGQRRRPYSIAEAPEQARHDDALEFLIGVDGDGHAGPHLSLTPGAMVDVEGPFGRFTFPETPDEQRFLFIAGGTGISPLRAMMRHALHVPHEGVGLLYSARTPDEFAYESELRELAARRLIELQLCVTRDTADQRFAGMRGRIGREQLAPMVHGRETLCFVCGPPALVQEIPRMLDELGVPRTRIRTEEWG